MLVINCSSNPFLPSLEDPLNIEVGKINSIITLPPASDELTASIDIARGYVHAIIGIIHSYPLESIDMDVNRMVD